MLTIRNAIRAGMLVLLAACTADNDSLPDPDASCEADVCASGGDAGVGAGADAGGDAGVDVRVPDASGETPEERDLRLWGTTGGDGAAKSPDGWGKCGLQDVRRDDLGTAVSSEVPPSPWETRPVADSDGRCGDDLETLSWRLMNCDRMQAGLDPLRCDLRLVWLGRQHSQDMISRDYFDHVNPSGQDPFERMGARGISYSAAGENIASFNAVDRAHLGWMDSDGHRRNILTSQFTHGGIGIIKPSQGNLRLTQLFLRP